MNDIPFFECTLYLNLSSKTTLSKTDINNVLNEKLKCNIF